MHRAMPGAVFAIALILLSISQVPPLVDDAGSPAPRGLSEVGDQEFLGTPAPKAEPTIETPEEEATEPLAESVEVPVETPSVPLEETTEEALVAPETPVAPEAPEVPEAPEAPEVPEDPEEAPEESSSVVVPANPPPRVDVLFCLDTTGSMGDEIVVVKAAVLNIAEAVAVGTPAPIVRYALVIFRDLGDEYVTQVFDFMDVEDLALILVDVRASNGGDYEESVSEALHRSVHDVDWDARSNMAIYLIGDAPPHTDYGNGFDHLQAARDAKDMGIVINAIGCSGIQGNEHEFLEVAEITGGAFVYLTYKGHGGSVTYYGDGEMCGGCYDSTGEGEGSGSGSGAPCGSGGGADGDTKDGGPTDDDATDGYSNDLDEVLTRMIQGQAMAEGVEYEDGEAGEGEGEG